MNEKPADSAKSERIKSILTFLLLVTVWFSLMKWVLPYFGVNT